MSNCFSDVVFPSGKRKGLTRFFFFATIFALRRDSSIKSYLLGLKYT